MVKGVFYRLIGRQVDGIPYGTHDEEQSLHVVTPVKYSKTVVLEQSVTAQTVEPAKVAESLEHAVTARVVVEREAVESVGLIQKMRNSLRRKKKNRDYDQFSDRPSPFKTPPHFLVERPVLPAPQNPWESPFGLEVLEQCITKKKAGQAQFKLDFSEDTPAHNQFATTLFENEENGSPSSAAHAVLIPTTTSENVGFDPEDSTIDAYFKTPDGIRKYHRRSKVLLSVKEDSLI
ncbi:hypothetical protein BV898_01041 [Hypsibius exemplaris]|uniref:Uncharacterized protein n=1 Tax=Hypsibius exemplaris TaxID=2072580 RepID=A0A1W0XDB7_HYPEX|nr:hypothetical protein BV898_01041 [Hypsibius exemplaris]